MRFLPGRRSDKTQGNWEEGQSGLIGLEKNQEQKEEQLEGQVL